MRITVDTELCTGAGQCALAAANVFDQRDDDGIVVLRQAEPPAGDHEAVRQAVLLCPTQAIRAEE
ncbi:ferredoxin [Actinomadura mexicana]|uniref:Ferredoxin n=1 Tax=Actinomadura mexicana TaxID=134959 RepID=A0A238X9P9_9ACTN|nr:ferredoxin [Actinomadura mexicana]SNR55084.1 Ferredoxin [Actinomadura mexicana]